MRNEFSKPEKMLFMEKQFRLQYERSQDAEYTSPHNFSYYESIFRDLTAKYPDCAPIKNIVDSLGEDLTFTNDADVEIIPLISFFPPIWHSNDYFIVQIVLEGEFSSHIGNQTFLMKKGDVCIIVPQVRHALSCFTESNIICIAIRRSTFEKAFFYTLNDTDSILGMFFSRVLYMKSSHQYLLFHCRHDYELKQILSEAYQESLGTKPYRNHMEVNLIDRFFVVLLRNHEKDVIFSENLSSGNSEKLMSILEYLQENYTTVSLKELAEMFNYSERQLQRIFKTNLGMSFSEMILSAKMKKAARLLKETGKTVSKIAEECGYKSPGNFRSSFHNIYGKSPAEYREEIQHDEKAPLTGEP